MIIRDPKKCEMPGGEEDGGRVRWHGYASSSSKTATELQGASEGEGEEGRTLYKKKKGRSKAKKQCAEASCYHLSARCSV